MMMAIHSDKKSWLDQENAYSNGCKVKYLLKSKTTLLHLITLFIIKRNYPSKSISKLSMQSLKGFLSSIPKALNAATPWEGIILILSTFFFCQSVCWPNLLLQGDYVINKMILQSDWWPKSLGFGKQLMKYRHILLLHLILPTELWIFLLNQLIQNQSSMMAAEETNASNLLNNSWIMVGQNQPDDLHEYLK